MQLNCPYRIQSDKSILNLDQSFYDSLKPKAVEKKRDNRSRDARSNRSKRSQSSRRKALQKYRAVGNKMPRKAQSIRKQSSSYEASSSDEMSPATRRSQKSYNDYALQTLHRYT